MQHTRLSGRRKWQPPQWPPSQWPPSQYQYPWGQPSYPPIAGPSGAQQPPPHAEDVSESPELGREAAELRRNEQLRPRKTPVDLDALERAQEARHEAVVTRVLNPIFQRMDAMAAELKETRKAAQDSQKATQPMEAKLGNFFGQMSPQQQSPYGYTLPYPSTHLPPYTSMYAPPYTSMYPPQYPPFP